MQDKKPLALTRILCICSIGCVKRYPFFILFFSILFSSYSFAERPFLTTETAIPTKRGTYRLEGGLAFSRLSENEKEAVLKGNLRYGLIHNLEFDLEIPYLFVETGGNNKNRPGDISLNTKIRFLKGRAASPLSVAGQMLIKFPTAGRKDDFKTSGVVDVGFRAIASKSFLPLTAHINLAYFFIGNPPNKVLPDQIRYALGIDFQTEKTPLKFVAELFGREDLESGNSDDQLTAMGGFSIQTQEDLFFDISAGFGLKKNSPDYILNGGATFFLN